MIVPLYCVEKMEFWGWLSTVLNPVEDLWFCGGDLNEILWEFEKHGGCDDFHTRPKFLHEFMEKMELIDLKFYGPKFTWMGNRNNGLVQEQLDRGLVNGGWQVRWPSTSISHGVVRGSNRCPIIVITKPPQTKGKKLFRFKAFWLKEDGCKEVVE